MHFRSCRWWRKLHSNNYQNVIFIHLEHIDNIVACTPVNNCNNMAWLCTYLYEATPRYTWAKWTNSWATRSSPMRVNVLLPSVRTPHNGRRELNFNSISINCIPQRLVNVFARHHQTPTLNHFRWQTHKLFINLCIGALCGDWWHQWHNDRGALL